MKSEGKEGGQSKFPRVLKKEKLESWLKFVQNLSMPLSDGCSY